MSDEELNFYTRWNHGEKDSDGTIAYSQEVQIHGMSDIMHNEFSISDCTASQFTIELENASLGTIVGKGVIKDNTIAWEFRNPELGFEGFEFYELQDDGSYQMRAEYATTDQFRTIIRGKIWPKAKEEK